MSDLYGDGHGPVRFLILADASPGLLSRLLEPLAKRDLTPVFVRAERDVDGMRAEIRLDSMPAAMVALVAGNMDQVIGVHRVQCDLHAAPKGCIGAVSAGRGVYQRP